jgi:hypothetical protein
MKSSPHFFALQRRWDAKEAPLIQRENIQRKSFWRLMFVGKELGESRSAPDEPKTDICQ